MAQQFMAHGQGLAALAASGSLLATSGWGSRAGQTIPDPFIKVHGLRSCTWTPSTHALVPAGLRLWDVLQYHHSQPNLAVLHVWSLAETNQCLSSSEHLPIMGPAALPRLSNVSMSCWDCAIQEPIGMDAVVHRQGILARLQCCCRACPLQHVRLRAGVRPAPGCTGAAQHPLPGRPSTPELAPPQHLHAAGSRSLRDLCAGRPPGRPGAGEWPGAWG